MPPSCLDSFEQAALPHLDQAYNLARWLARDEHDAEDIVQEAFLRALRFHRSFRGGNMGPWLLKIVRNTYYTWRQQNRMRDSTELDKDFVWGERDFESPEDLAIQRSNSEMLRSELEAMAPWFRELLVLREIHGLSYQEISEIVGVPIGTVMSSLSRARARLRQSLLKMTTGSV